MTSIRVNVRTLAEFHCEGGDLGPATGAMEAMRQGMISHQARQTTYGEEDTSEAALSGTYLLNDVALELYGRADGIRKICGEWGIEEIKWVGHTLPEDWDGEAVHWLQACLYGLLLCDREGQKECAVSLVYMDGAEARTLMRKFSRAALYDRLREAGEPFLRWQIQMNDLRERRMETAKSLPFPFASYREGQQRLSRNAYIALRDGKQLVCEAPTGLGKTMATLFAAVRAMGEGHIQRTFFLTARGTGRQAAQDAIEKMREKGLRIRWISLYAKEKMCALESPVCDPKVCPRARGYFDRRRAALEESLKLSELSREAVEALAESHCLCPFELTLDLAETADVIIADYNYAFDPRVRLQRFFLKRTGVGLLVDEAHNLPDRAREMYSAEIKIAQWKARRREIGKAQGRADPVYRALSRFLKACKAEAEPNLNSIAPRLESLRDDLEKIGATNEEIFWDTVWFLRRAQQMDEACDESEINREGLQIRCMEPGIRLEKCLKKIGGAVFFSATLQPLTFYRDRLGVRKETSALLELPSPFPPENLRVTCAPVSTRFRDRERTLPAVAGLIGEFARQVKGNILVCFPSYAYLEAARELLPEDGGRKWLYQKKNMDDAARAELLSAFASGELVGAFVTMGGLFSEGIDLTGDQLVGAVVVSAGLPQVSEKTERLRAWYDGRGERGFDFVYAYPGAARVSQAVGRVIRSETDVGRALLIDDRWLRPEYRALLPKNWSL